MGAFSALGALGTAPTLAALGTPPMLIGLGATVVGLGLLGKTSKVLRNPKKAYRTLFSSPYKGDALLLEIYGADLSKRSPDGHENTEANGELDGWWAGKPDCYVKFHHGSTRGQTHVQGNTFHPRYYFQRQIPWDKRHGFEFQVWESDVFREDKIVGRCYVRADKVKDSLKNNQPILITLGTGIGKLKVAFHGPLTYKMRQGQLLTETELKTREVIAASRGVVKPAMVIDVDLTKEQKKVWAKQKQKASK